MFKSLRATQEFPFQETQAFIYIYIFYLYILLNAAKFVKKKAWINYHLKQRREKQKFKKHKEEEIRQKVM